MEYNADIVIEGNNLNETIRKIKKHIDGKSFKEVLEDKDRFFTNIFNEDDELFDFDYDCLSGTIHNTDGKAELGLNFDFWNDKDCYVLFRFEIH